jgi:hypothetical protein
MDRQVDFNTGLYVDSVPAIVSGRELCGYPKTGGTHFGGTVEALAAKRDAAEIALMRALGEIPEPSCEQGQEERKEEIR